MSFNISYVYQAIDKFTPVAKQIKKSLSGISKTAATAKRKIDRLGNSVRTAGKKLTAFATTSIGFLGFKMVKAAIDAEESRSKFLTVFRDISIAAEKSAKNLSRNFGLSKTESEVLLGTTGDLLTGFGFSQKAALKMSDQVQQLAVDLASFTNVQGGTKRASDALTKGLLGERESLKLLGIVINEKLVKAKIKDLAASGKLVGVSLQQAKAMATLQIAMDQSKNSIGDFARTQQSAANLSRVALAASNDLNVSLGRFLLPTYVKIVKAVTSFIRKLEDASPGIKKMILIVGGLVFVLGPLLATLGLVAVGIGALISPIGFVVVAVGSIIAVLSTLAIKFKFIRDIGRFSFEAVALAITLVVNAIKAIGSSLSNILPKFEVFSKVSESLRSFIGGTLGGAIGRGADNIAQIRKSINVVSAVNDNQSVGVAAQGGKANRLDGTINVNAPPGVVQSVETRKTAPGNLGMNMAGAGG